MIRFVNWVSTQYISGSAKYSTGYYYKELFLLHDRSSKSSITIATPELLQQYEQHLFLLQQVREKIKLNFCPGSIFIFKTQQIEDSKLQWDFCDFIDTMFIGVRMGEVALIGILADGGAQQAYEEDYKDFDDIYLHPIQFRELCAQFCYRSTLATRNPKHITIEGQPIGEPHEVHQMPLGGFSLKPYFEDGNSADYAKYLSFYLGVSYDYVFTPPDTVRTWLHNEEGIAQFIDFKEHPDLPFTFRV